MRRKKMKIKYLIGIIMICLLVFVNGCSKGDDSDNLVVDDLNEVSGSAVDDNRQDSEAESQDSDSNEQDDVVVIEYDAETNAELVAELMKDLVDEDQTEEDTEEDGSEDSTEEVADEEKEIILDNFRGDPKDVTIEKGTTVKWTNMMHFSHVIIILPKRDDNTYENRWINEDLEQLWYDESYEYTFNEVGNFKWGSKTKFDITNGKVVVVDSN
jgi:plastocyanin